MGAIIPLIDVARARLSPIKVAASLIRVVAEDRAIDVSRVVPWPTLFVAPGSASNRVPTSGSADSSFTRHAGGVGGVGELTAVVQ